MNRFAALFLIAAICSSGCRSLAPAILREQTVIVTPESTPAKPVCRVANGGESAHRSAPVSDSTADSWLVRPDLRNAWAASANTQPRLAGDVWNDGGAAVHGPLLDCGWLGDRSVSVGVRAMPCNCLSEELKAVNAFVKLSQGENQTWFVGWSFSGAGKQPYPIPRVHHVWQVSERVRLNAGVMFSNMVDPTFDVSVTFQR